MTRRAANPCGWNILRLTKVLCQHPTTVLRRCSGTALGGTRDGKNAVHGGTCATDGGATARDCCEGTATRPVRTKPLPDHKSLRRQRMNTRDKVIFFLHPAQTADFRRRSLYINPRLDTRRGPRTYSGTCHSGPSRFPGLGGRSALGARGNADQLIKAG